MVPRSKSRPLDLKESVKFWFSLVNNEELLWDGKVLCIFNGWGYNGYILRNGWVIWVGYMLSSSMVGVGDACLVSYGVCFQVVGASQSCVLSETGDQQSAFVKSSWGLFHDSRPPNPVGYYHFPMKNRYFLGTAPFLDPQQLGLPTLEVAPGHVLSSLWQAEHEKFTHSVASKKH